MKVKANGITFNYRLDGAEGLPWLIFSNSLATTLEMWDEQTAQLQSKFRLLRYDQSRKSPQIGDVATERAGVPDQYSLSR